MDYTSEELEMLARGILRKELAYWQQEALNLNDFTEDTAIEVLVEKGVRPSRLGCDLGFLVQVAKAESYGVPSWMN